MAVAVLCHCAAHFVRFRPVLGPSIGRRLVALACYVAVPAGVIGAASVLGGAGS